MPLRPLRADGPVGQALGALTMTATCCEEFNKPVAPPGAAIVRSACRSAHEAFEETRFDLRPFELEPRCELLGPGSELGI